MRVEPIDMFMPLGNRIKESLQQEAPAQTFEEVLSGALGDVNRLQVKAEEVTKKMVLGEIDDIHQVMLATEQAKMALQLTVQIRNKMVEAYQEIARMQF